MNGEGGESIQPFISALQKVSDQRTKAGRFNEFITSSYCITAITVAFFPVILELMGVDFSRGGIVSVRLLFIYFSSITFLGYFLSRLEVELQTMGTFLHRGFDFFFFTYFYFAGEFQLLFVVYVMLMGPSSALGAYLFWRKERTYPDYWKSLFQRLNPPTRWFKAITLQGYWVGLVGCILIFFPQEMMQNLGMGFVTEPYQFGFFRFYGLMVFFLGFTYVFNGYHAIEGFGHLLILQQLYFVVGFFILGWVTGMPQELVIFNVAFMGSLLCANLVLRQFSPSKQT